MVLDKKGFYKTGSSFCFYKYYNNLIFLHVETQMTMTVVVFIVTYYSCVLIKTNI